MTRREKNRRLQEAAARRKEQEAKDARTCKQTWWILFTVNLFSGVAAGILLLACMGYGVLAAENVLVMAIYPALAAALLFTLYYGVNYGIFHLIRATRPRQQKLARRATAVSFAAALLTLLLCILLEPF